MALSIEERAREITDWQIVKLSEEIASAWLKIARHLPHARGREEHKLAFKLGDSRLDAIRKDCIDDEERMVEVLRRWRAMSSLHTWGLLWDTIDECGYGRAAREILDCEREESASGKMHA